MLAKCSRCSQTFQTDRFGEQACPFCGTAVSIAPPNAPPAAMIAPPSPNDPQDQAAPVDEPAANGGWVSALMKTWRLSMFEPTAFFSRLRPGPGWGGAYVFAAVCILVGGPFVGFNTGLTLLLQTKGMDEQARQLPAFAEMLSKISGHWPAIFITLAVVMPLFGLVSIFFNAALYHLALMLVGGNKAGFTATMRAIALATGPYVLGVVPFCGSTIAGIWMLILPVYTLSQLHRISIGRSVGALFATWALTCCCLGVPLGGLSAVGLSSYIEQAKAAGHASTALPPMDDLPDNP